MQRGCLTRTCNDLPADGSRIEGSHKGWNSIQRSFASGLEVFCALAHDFVLRRNVRVGSAQGKANGFLSSTFGSHHVQLFSHVAAIWNQLLQHEKQIAIGHSRLPELQDIESGETFGLVESRYTETFGGLLEVKDEDNEGDEITLTHDGVDAILQEIGIDPALCFLPLVTGGSGHSSTEVPPTVISDDLVVLHPNRTSSLGTANVSFISGPQKIDNSLSDQHNPMVVGSAGAEVQHGTVLSEKAVVVGGVVDVDEVTVSNLAVTSTDVTTTASKRARLDGTGSSSNKRARTVKVSTTLFWHARSEVQPCYDAGRFRHY